MGWRGLERKPLAQRLRSPLASLVDQLAELAPEGVVEWVDRKDDRVERMLANRDDVFDDYRWESFVACRERRFTLLAKAETHAGRRRLCHVRLRG